MKMPPPSRLICTHFYTQIKGAHPGRRVGDPNPLHPYPRVEAGVELVELVLGGRGWVRIGEELAEVTTGALLWHMEGDEPISRSDWDNPYRCFVVAFAAPPAEGRRRTARLAWWNDHEEAQKFCNDVMECYLDDRPDDDFLFHYAYGRLLFQSRICDETGIYSTLSPKLRLALELIRRSYASPISLSELAEQVGWSLPHLTEAFRKELKTTPYQFMLQRRIKVAKEKLTLGHSSIKEIAADCGFPHAAAFCHAFKARTGMTPLRYREIEQARYRSRQGEVV